MNDNARGGLVDAGAGSGSEFWNKLMNGALMVPGAVIDREMFLRASLKPHFPREQVDIAVERNPAAAGITVVQIAKLAEGSMAYHRTRLSVTSAVAGLPGGWWIAGTIPADTAQFIWHTIVVVQKYAYLYGWPDLRSEDGKLDDESRQVVTMFIGAMLGASGAVATIEKVAEELAKQATKRLPKVALTKFGLYNLAKQIARWLGVELTKKKFGSYVARAIPVLGGVVSGAVSWATFSTMSRKLIGHLEKQNLAKPGPEDGGQVVPETIPPAGLGGGAAESEPSAQSGSTGGGLAPT